MVTKLLKFIIRYLRWLTKISQKFKPFRYLYLSLIAAFTIIKINWNYLKGFAIIRYIRTFNLIFSYINLLIDFIILVIYMQFDILNWIPTIPAFLLYLNIFLSYFKAGCFSRTGGGALQVEFLSLYFYIIVFVLVMIIGLILQLLFYLYFMNYNGEINEHKAIKYFPYFIIIRILEYREYEPKTKEFIISHYYKLIFIYTLMIFVLLILLIVLLVLFY